MDTVAHELAKVQDDVYAYLFKWGGIGSGPSPFDFIYGAGHAAEIPFFFGADQGLFGYPFVPANEAGRKDLQHAMMEYLANFAWTGNPNHYFPSPVGEEMVPLLVSPQVEGVVQRPGSAQGDCLRRRLRSGADRDDERGTDGGRSHSRV